MAPLFAASLPSSSEGASPPPLPQLGLMPQLGVLPRLGALAGGVGTMLIGAIAALSAGAAPPPDLRPYPPAAPGERRWFIPVGTPPGAGTGAGANVAGEQRVELILGRWMLVDCNRHFLQGAVVEDSVPGWGYPLFRVKGGSQLVSTRMACPGQGPRRTFVRLGGAPALVPVNPRLPIVVVAPQDLEVRWRLWRPDPGERSAQPF